MKRLSSVASQSRPNHSIAGRLVFSLLVLALAVGIFIYRQAIIDQVTVWRYAPSGEVKALAERVRLNDRGEFYFYASQPEIQERSTFNQSCTTTRGESTAVLGCYVAQRIYLFNVTDEQLDGIREVTAAHEMLHAVYERMEAKERARIDDLLMTQAAKITDPTFVTLMKEYEKTEPGERANELHSIIGTQIKDLSPELEAYYGRFFEDRQTVVALYAKYDAVFAALKAKQEALGQELDALAAQVQSEISAYNESVARLNADIGTFNDRARSGEFSSQAEFNNARNVLLSRQQVLTASRARTNELIATYNSKREQLAAINSEAQALNRSINSNLTPVPSI